MINHSFYPIPQNNKVLTDLAHSCETNVVIASIDGSHSDFSVDNISRPASLVGLDWTAPGDPSDVGLYDERSLDLLDLLDRKVQGDHLFRNCWGELAIEHDYARQMALAIKSRHPQRNSLVRCGQWNGYGYQPCNDTRLCWACCIDRRVDIVAEFEKALERQAEAWIITLSLSCEPSHWRRVVIRDLRRPPLSGDNRYRDDVRCHVPLDQLFFPHALMRIFRSCVRQFSRSRTKPVTGVLGRTEMALRYDGTWKGLPHGHWVMFSDRLDENELRALLARVTEKIATFPMLHRWLKSLGLYPMVHARRIGDTRGLKAALRYVMKPVDLVTPYRAAVSAAAHDNLACINIPFAAIVRDLPLVFHGLDRLTRLGGCVGNSGCYFGVKSEKRKSARKGRDGGHTGSVMPWENRIDNHDDFPPPAKSNDDEHAMMDEFIARAMDLDAGNYGCRLRQVVRSKQKAADRKAIARASAAREGDSQPQE